MERSGGGDPQPSRLLLQPPQAGAGWRGGARRVRIHVGARAQSGAPCSGGPTAGRPCAADGWRLPAQVTSTSTAALGARGLAKRPTGRPPRADSLAPEGWG